MARNLEEPGANFNQLLELSLKLQNARTFAGTVADATTEVEQYADGGRIGLKDGGSLEKLLRDYWQGMGPWGKGSTGAFYFSDLYDALAPYLGMFNEGGRVGFSNGKKVKNPGRRAFMKTAAGVGALLPFGIGKIFKLAKPITDFTVKLRTSFYNSDVDYGTSGLAHFDISALTPKVKKVLQGLMKNKVATKPGLKGKDYFNIDPGDAKSVIKELKKSGFNGKITGIVDDGTDILDDAVKGSKKHPALKEWADTFKKQSMKQNIKEHSKRNYVVYENDPGWIKHMDEAINASSKSTKATDKVIHKPWTSTIDEVVDLLEPVVKKAEGGRIYGKYAQQLASGGRAGYQEGNTVLPKIKPFTADMFKDKADLYLQGIFAGPNKDLFLPKIRSVLKQAVNEGSITQEEGMKFISDRILFYKNFAEENPKGTLPRWEKNKGGRVGLAEGDTPSQAWMRDYFYSSGLDDKGIITLYEFINGPLGWKAYMEHGPGKS